MKYSCSVAKLLFVRVFKTRRDTRFSPSFRPNEACPERGRRAEGPIRKEPRFLPRMNMNQRVQIENRQSKIVNYASRQSSFLSFETRKTSGVMSFLRRQESTRDTRQKHGRKEMSKLSPDLARYPVENLTTWPCHAQGK